MSVGYIYVSNEVMKDGKPIGYFYRDEPDDEADSGWRIFSGEETQDYADDASNFALYNAHTIVELHPWIAPMLAREHPVAFERDPRTGDFVEMIDEDR